MKAVVGIGILAAAALLGMSTPTNAQHAAPRLSLRWNAPDDCPDDAELVRAVEDFLGEPLATVSEQQLSISLNVAGGSGGFSAKMRFKSATSTDERYLEHPECRKLMEACALLVALAIDPERVKARQARQHPRATTTTPVVAAEPVAAPPTSAAITPVLSANEPERLRDQPGRAAVSSKAQASPALKPELEVMGFAGAGVLPKVGPGLAGELALERRHIRLAVVGRYWIPRTAAVPQSQNAGIELGLWTLGARACALPWLGNWSLRGCIGVDLGDMAGTGRGLERSRTSHAVFSAFTAGLGVRYGQQRLAPVLGLDGGWAASRAPFGLLVNSREVEVFRPDPFSLSGFVGLSYLL